MDGNLLLLRKLSLTDLCRLVGLMTEMVLDRLERASGGRSSRSLLLPGARPERPSGTVPSLAV